MSNQLAETLNDLLSKRRADALRREIKKPQTSDGMLPRWSTK
jgi:hypothetical protein